MSDINDLKNEVFLHFDNQKIFKLGKAFKRFMQKAKLTPQELSELYVELSRRNPNYFMEQIYPGLQMVSKYQSLDEILERNNYIFKKYCLLEGEDIITTFYGVTSEKKTISRGWIYLTNFRLISFGRQITRSAQKQVGRSSIVGALVRSGITRHRKAIQGAIMRAFHKDLKEWNLVEWGYYYPIYNAMKIKRSKKSISYIINVDIGKIVSVSIDITPLRLNKQPKDQFAEQRENTLNIIVQKLIEYQ
ncbi:MAG: hypothetical protein ACFFBH_17420 [Promethearchaeota archaeon]